ncbi:MAG: CopG family transcriptional regulator [Alphaproteobacteria bacterium]|nr:CopG family transcriptional regulator [Alphaproteobacteria bacterium]
MIESACPLPDFDDDDAETAALAAAVAEARADPRIIPHEDMQAWLLRLAAGEFNAPPPEPCPL